MEHAAHTLTVRGAAATYPVNVGPGLLNDALPRFVAQLNPSGVAVISNEIVGPLYGEELAERIPGAYLITVPDGEQYKTLATVQALYDALLAQSADRSTVIIALGGGVMGDMAGFAAATFMRGVRLVQVPTSLLAMVDASIGGKVGVDLPQGKNLVGAFKDPLAVFADTLTLDTLPKIEIYCGMAEVIKAALLADADLLADLRSDGVGWPDVAQRAAAVKAEVVAQDRTEQGIRAILNLGHTFGHALEQVSGYRWKHGLAVSVGMAAAARLSARLGLCNASLVSTIEDLLQEHHLPVRYTEFAPATLWDAMQHDKKWRNGVSRFVLLKGIGQPVIKTGVSRKDVLAVLDDVREDV